MHGLDAGDAMDEPVRDDWSASGRLLDAQSGAPLARVECQLWVIDPTPGHAGKWGGTVSLVAPISPALKPFDFAFILELDDGRRGAMFSELDLATMTGSIDGNGPPPSLAGATDA